MLRGNRESGFKKSCPEGPFKASGSAALRQPCWLGLGEVL